MPETLTTNLKTTADTADKEFIGADTDNAEYLRNITDLTNAELKELEKKPKSQREILWDKIICFLPALTAVLHLIEYLYYPNLPGNTATNVYTWFLVIFIVYFLIRAVIALVNEKQMRRWRHAAPFQSLVFLLLMIYDILTLKTGTLLLPYFPWVDEIFTSIIGDASYLAESTAASLSLLFQGYFMGAALGILTGIMCGYFEKVNYWIAPFTTVIGSIPTTTWLPIVMVLASSLRNGAVFVIALGVFFALTNATFSGVRSIDESQFEIARILGADQSQLITRVAVPSILPNVFTGLIQGMSTACTSLIVAEMVGVESGLGWYITWQKNWAEYDKMYAGILVISIMFLTVNFLLRYSEKRLLKWKDA